MLYQKDGRSYIADKFIDGTLRITEIYNVDVTAFQPKREVKKGNGNIEGYNQRLAISLCRTKHNIYDIVHSMKIDYFCTFTFNPAYHIDRTDIDACKKYLGTWLSNERKKYPDMQYLFIPEYHTLKAGQKSEGVHFHGVIGNIPDSAFKYSGVKQKGRKVYNYISWKAGFTNCTKSSNPQKCANYMLKYVTKTLFKNISGFGKQRYLVSQNIERPQRVYTDFVKGINSFLDVNAFSSDNGEYFPLPDDIANNLGDYEFMASSPIDINKKEFNYHAKRYFYKLKG